jgi:hypothetical protein
MAPALQEGGEAMIPMTPRELIALGFGAIFTAIFIAMFGQEPCRRACCLPRADAGLPPRHYRGLCLHPKTESCELGKPSEDLKPRPFMPPSDDSILERVREMRRGFMVPVNFADHRNGCQTCVNACDMMHLPNLCDEGKRLWEMKHGSIYARGDQRGPC